MAVIDEAIARIPTRYKLDAMWTLLGIVLLMGCGFGLGIATGTHTTTIHSTRTVHDYKPIRSVADLEAALGAPTQTQTQNGTTCAIWQTSTYGVEICHR